MPEAAVCISPAGAAEAAGCCAPAAAGAFTEATAASRLLLWLKSQSAARSRLPLQALSAASDCTEPCTAQSLAHSKSLLSYSKLLKVTRSSATSSCHRAAEQHLLQGGARWHPHECFL